PGRVPAPGRPGRQGHRPPGGLPGGDAGGRRPRHGARVVAAGAPRGGAVGFRSPPPAGLRSHAQPRTAAPWSAAPAPPRPPPPRRVTPVPPPQRPPPRLRLLRLARVAEFLDLL